MPKNDVMASGLHHPALHLRYAVRMKPTMAMMRYRTGAICGTRGRGERDREYIERDVLPGGG